MSYTNEIRKDIKSYLKQKCENVYYLKASDSSSFPYIVFSVRSIGEGKVLELDIWDKYKDTTRIENLVEDIEEMLLDEGRGNENHCIAFDSNDDRQFIEDSDKELQRINESYELFYDKK